MPHRALACLVAWRCLSEVRGVAAFGVVAQPEPDGVVDGQLVQLGRADEADVGGLVTDP